MDPFIEHNEIRRQKCLTDEYDDRFLKKPGMQPAADCCDSCSRIDFHAISNHKGTLEGTMAFSLREIGSINSSWSERACHFCRFLAGIWEENKSYLRNASLCLIILSSRHISNHSMFTQTPESNYYHNILALSHPQPHRVFDIDDTVLDNIDIVGALFPSRRKANTKKIISVRAIQTDRIDFSIIRDWLRHCDKSHGDSCSKAELPQIPGFRLLNCKTRLLEPYHAGTKFVALSYVWGTNVEKQMKESSNEGLPGLPLTIEDASKVVLELGFQYLWVDRYCIPQFDDNAKQIQIASMDMIYNCASLTIIAACGRGSAFGLPGVSARSRPPQPSIRIDDHEIISTGSNPVRDVRNSVWMGRGWTYQEALLSKRRLIFTKKQVYFECGRGTFKEAISEPEKLLSEYTSTIQHEKHVGKLDTLLDTRNRLFPADYLNQTHDDAWLIHHRIAEYTSRSLTFESDTIDAFLGALKHFRNPNSSLSHVWGVPVLWSAKKWTAMEGFVTGLCWIGTFPTTQAIERRIGFPSWSWAGWKWKISAKSYFYRFGFKTPYDIQVSFETTSGEILDWDNYQALSRDTESSALSQYLRIEAWSLKCRLFHDSDVYAGGNYNLRDQYRLAVEGSEITLPLVIIHKLFSREEWEARRETMWDVLIIGNTENPVAADTKYFELLPPFGPLLMILEDMGDHHERIGYLDLAHCDSTTVGGDMSKYLVGKKRRTFRLG